MCLLYTTLVTSQWWRGKKIKIDETYFFAVKKKIYHKIKIGIPFLKTSSNYHVSKILLLFLYYLDIPNKELILKLENMNWSRMFISECKMPEKARMVHDAIISKLWKRSFHGYAYNCIFSIFRVCGPVSNWGSLNLGLV